MKNSALDYVQLSIQEQILRQEWLVNILETSSLTNEQQKKLIVTIIMKLSIDSLSRLDKLQDFLWEWWEEHKSHIHEPKIRLRFLQIFHFKSWQRFEECAELFTGRSIDLDLPKMIGRRYKKKHESILEDYRRLLCTVGLISNYTEHISNVRFIFHPNFVKTCTNTNLQEHLQSIQRDSNFYVEQQGFPPRFPAILCNISDVNNRSYVMLIYIELMNQSQKNKLFDGRKLEAELCLFPIETSAHDCEELELYKKKRKNDDVYCLKLNKHQYQTFVFYGFQLLNIHPNSGIDASNLYRGTSIKEEHIENGLPKITTEIKDDFHEKYPNFPRGSQ